MVQAYPKLNNRSFSSAFIACLGIMQVVVALVWQSFAKSLNDINSNLALKVR